MPRIRNVCTMKAKLQLYFTFYKKKKKKKTMVDVVFVDVAQGSVNLMYGMNIIFFISFLLYIWN